jgi:hypothetical protein
MGRRADVIAGRTCALLHPKALERLARIVVHAHGAWSVNVAVAVNDHVNDYVYGPDEAELSGVDLHPLGYSARGGSRDVKRPGPVVLGILVAACGGTVAITPDGGGSADATSDGIPSADVSPVDAALDTARTTRDASDEADATVPPQDARRDTTPDVLPPPDARDSAPFPDVADTSVVDTSIANPDGCPSSFATSGGPCVSYGATCSYPEGTCSCCPPLMGCYPRTCDQQGIACGPAGDGCGSFIECGSCAPPFTCGGGGRPGACGNDAGSVPVCVPKTCPDADAGCGVVDDGCGGQLDCSIFCGTWLCNTMCF